MTKLLLVSWIICVICIHLTNTENNLRKPKNIKGLKTLQISRALAGNRNLAVKRQAQQKRKYIIKCCAGKTSCAYGYKSARNLSRANGSNEKKEVFGPGQEITRKTGGGKPGKKGAPPKETTNPPVISPEERKSTIQIESTPEEDQTDSEGAIIKPLAPSQVSGGGEVHQTGGFSSSTSKEDNSNRDVSATAAAGAQAGASTNNKLPGGDSGSTLTVNSGQATSRIAGFNDSGPSSTGFTASSISPETSPSGTTPSGPTISVKTVSGSSSSRIVTSSGTAATGSVSSTSTSRESSTIASTTSTTTTVNPLITCDKQRDKNPALLEADGRIKDVAQYGAWLELCNDAILFGNRLVNWTENYDLCLDLGMRPLYFLGTSDQTCLQKYISASWAYNYNYWSAGMKDGTSDPNWCSMNNSKPGSSIAWDKNKTEMYDCMRMKILPKSSPTPLKIVWGYRNCSSKFLMACKAPLGSTKSCTEWKKDSSYFTGPNSTIKDPQNYGNWLQAFHHTFLFASKNLNWANAVKQCGVLGMKIVSFNKPEIFLFMSLLMKNYTFLAKSYWTSGYDKEGPGKFSWCSVNNAPVLDLKWKDGKAPSTAGCLKVTFPKTNASSNEPIDLTPYFNAEDCVNNNSFICIAKNPQDPMQLQKDCMATFGVSQAEIDTLLTKPSFTTNIKCFLRCMGEQLNLLFGNLPSTVDVMKLIEMTAGSDGDMSKQLDIYDSCNQKPDPADGCASAANVFKCGVDSDPSRMANLVVASSSLIASDAKSGKVIPDIKYATCPIYPCVTDSALVAKRSNYLNEVPTSDGYFVNACGKVYFFGQSNNAVGLNASVQYCCKFGMTLARLRTFEQMMCLFDANKAMPPHAFKRNSTNGRLFGVNIGSPNFPVWCPDNTPVDMSLFKTYSSGVDYSVNIATDDNHPVILPYLYMGDQTSNWSPICEDGP